MKIEAAPRRRKSDLLIGTCAAMKRVLDQVSVAAGSAHPVLLEGESGTGKELIARTIHATGIRATGAFLSIHCGVIPEVLLEGELLGLLATNPLARFTRGSGLVAEAAAGTIFLDQVEEIPRKLQSRLIAILSGAEPLPGADSKALPPRLIAATSRKLSQSARESGFDPDLLRSLREFTIEIPPLRKRGEDIPLLAAHFLNRFAEEIPSEVQGIASEAQARMLQYAWPGNVRELENKMRQAMLVARGDTLGVDDLFLQHPRTSDKVLSFKEAKRQFEKQYISQVLRVSGGNISRAARLAKKDRKDFYDVMRRNGIDPRSFRGKNEIDG
jgi:two-component system response regulator GlrR